MGVEWTSTTLGEVLTLQRGFDLPETNRTAGPYPVIASTGAVGTHEKAMVKGPGVVIGRSGSLGGGQFIENDFWPLNTTCQMSGHRLPGSVMTSFTLKGHFSVRTSFTLTEHILYDTLFEEP